jgi:hypothetical protein
MVHVPYKGSGPALSALMGGETQLMFSSLASTLPFVKSGRLRPLAVTSAKRSAAVADLPTVAESGFPGFEAITWHGMLVPAGVPPAIIQRLNAEVVKILNSPEFINWLLTQGADATPSTPEEFTAFIRTEIDKGFDQDGRLDRHVKGTRDANAGEGLAFGILFADRHQPGHFFLGDFNLFASPVGEGHVLDFVVGKILCGFVFRGEGGGVHVGFLLVG